MVTSIRVNTQKKADGIVALLKAENRVSFYDQFWSFDGCEYILFYRTR